MQARGPLMIEHRLIEQMLNVLQRILKRALLPQAIDPFFVDAAVDFIRVYADRTHHGKEEDIMFRDLHMKQLSEKDRLLMDELIEDHIFSRNTTRALLEANMRYRRGNETALGEHLLTWCWAKDEERYLIVVNLSAGPTQALIRVPWDEMREKMWRLDDRLSGKTFERSGNDMRDAGLYVDLAPWKCHVFQIHPL